ncbi:MAG: hypothetical protein HYV26_01240 [Candidatus Hydrogenedentes bacterium]|nr:hypothetical protein [Candidatus Hydrogenedentota bacterium]MBI3119968.1 hypothetical protein [Candidatus Hydrogenedentota bacterium]
MAQAEMPKDHLTDYERAVCYYALPRVLNPITFGIIVAYAVCILEALVAIVVGIAIGHQLTLVIGTVALGAMIIFGLVVFFVRALLSEVRKRRLLEAARRTPDAAQDVADLPDPFATHVLLKRPTHAASALYACTENDATIQYLVDNVAHGLWKVKTPQDTEVFTVKVLRGPGSFLFGQDLPRLLGVYRDGNEIARIVRRFSFDSAIAQIEAQGDGPRLQVRQRGIYQGDRLVGRIYPLRSSYYLDIETAALSEGMLAYFVTVT